MRIRTAVAATGLAAATVLGGAAMASAHDHGTNGASAQGSAVGSPGVLSGNVVQIPVHVPVNLCGNSINVLGAVNPAFGNACANG
ncbi:chaplin [Streptomyces sp. NPDC005438]|uniref:chaplin n=1 Tax=Streptomyces sp. NPDC005438 TaxID=3156880 RepID=UPI0033AF7260